MAAGAPEPRWPGWSGAPLRWPVAAAALGLCAAALVALVLAMGAHGERARRLPGKAGGRAPVWVAETPQGAVGKLLEAGVHGAVVVQVGATSSAEAGPMSAWLPLDRQSYARPFALEQPSAVELVRRRLSRETHAFALTRLGPARRLVQLLTPGAWEAFPGKAAAGAGACAGVNAEAGSRLVCRALPPLAEPVVLFLSARWFVESGAGPLGELLRGADVAALVVSLDADDPAVTPEARQAAKAFAEALGAGR